MSLAPAVKLKKIWQAPLVTVLKEQQVKRNEKHLDKHFDNQRGKIVTDELVPVHFDTVV